MGRHYLFDVLTGLALGAVTVGIVTGGSYARAGLLLRPHQVQQALSVLALWAQAAGWQAPPWVVQA